MVLRKLRKGQGPYCHPRKADACANIERLPPAIPGHDEYDRRRGYCVSDPSGSVGNTLSVASSRLWHPTRHCRRGGWKGCSLTEAEKQPRKQHGGKSACHTRQDGGA